LLSSKIYKYLTFITGGQHSLYLSSLREAAPLRYLLPLSLVMNTIDDILYCIMLQRPSWSCWVIILTDRGH